ncbi:MAG: NUDIX domain-containing protein [Anaerolineae bacterium]|nr:NUDIX domain-containing protein [Anaerolineae bacterium]
MGARDQGADAITGRWLTIPRTLSFVTHGEDVLLLKRGPHRRVFPNKYNGVGGHIERTEDPLSSAIREIREETGLEVQRPLFCGVSHIDAGQDTGILLLIFRAEALSRNFLNSSEGTLEWVPQADILRYDLVEDLPIVLPRVLAQRPGDPPFFIHLSYNEADEVQIHFASDSPGED